eukprot:gene44008-35714_t
MVRAGPLEVPTPHTRFFNTVTYQRHSGGAEVGGGNACAASVAKNVLARGRASDSGSLHHVIAKALPSTLFGGFVVAAEPSHGDDGHRVRLLRELLHHPA